MTRRRVWVLILLIAGGLEAAEDIDARYTRGLAAYHAGDYAGAIAAFDDVLRSRPEQAAAFYYRGLAKARLGRYDDAVADMNAAAQRDPQLPVAGSLGAAYFEMRRYDEAKQWLQRAIDQGENVASANLALGIIAYEEEDYALAEQRLQAASGDPNAAGTAAFYRGLIARRQGREAEARALFEQAQAAGVPMVAEAAARQLAANPEATQFSSVRARPFPVPGAPVARLYVLAGFEYDSNVVLEDTPLITDEADGRFVFGAGGTYSLMNDERVRWDIGYDFYQNIHFQIDEIKLQGHTVRSSVEVGSGIVTPGLHAAYNAYLLEADGYFHEILGTPYASIDEAGYAEGLLFYRIRARDYFATPFDPAQDAINHAVGVRQIVPVGTGEVDAGYQFDRNDPVSSFSGRDFDYKGHEVDAGVVWPFPEIAEIELRYGYRNEDYLHGNSAFLPIRGTLPDGTGVSIRTKRRDDSHYVSLAGTRDLTEQIYVRLGYRFRTNDSNVPTFSYDRHTVSAIAGVRF